MRKNYIYIALSCAALFTLGSCVEENLEPVKPAQTGDEIIFGVRAGFEDSDPKTKTEYGGKESEYEFSGKTYERINWVAGDMVEIYSPDAANNSRSFHYTVTKTSTDPQPESGENGNNPSVNAHLKDYAYLTRYGDAGIQWGAAKTHRFYAMYPSSVMWTANADPAVTVASGVYMDYENGKPIVHGIIPITQNPTKDPYESTAGNWVIPADMKYAYMVATGEATKEDASVALTFVPIVTAVEIELELDSPANSYETVDAVEVGYVQVIGSGIAGAFTADLSEWSENGYPKCSNSDNGTDVITIDVRGANQQLRTITAGCSLTFTVFVRPGANISDLNVSFFDGTRFIGKDLKGANIPMNLKTRIVDLRLPKNVTELPVYADKWMDRISGNVEMKALSLPGTGNSVSYGYNNQADKKYFATQSSDMTLDKQWNLGIRAFEIVSDRPAHKSNNTEDLGTMPVECNKQPVTFTVNNESKSTVKDALLAIASKVRPSGTTEKDWTETAVVILTYQPHQGRVRSRNSKYYAYALKNLYDSIEEVYNGIFELYTPNMTLDDARGRILLLCRINQRHEGETETADTDNGGSSATSVSWANTNFQAASTYLNQNDIKVVLINGCGTGKDKWGRRGYTVGESKTPVLDIDSKVSNVAEAEGKTYSYVEQYMDTEKWGGNVNFPQVDVTGDTNPGGADFTYSTNVSGYNCWFQEWARVADGGGAAGGTDYFRHRWTETSWFGGSTTYYSAYWYNSYDEKLGNAAYTFKKAINDDSASLIYINWLGGYLIDEAQEGGYQLYSTAQSSWGGDGGDVKGLADKLNPDFMKVVEASGWENKTGPAGIVMIDYVGATPGAEELPGTILMNNFRHDAAAGGGVIITPPGGSGDDLDNEIEE